MASGLCILFLLAFSLAAFIIGYGMKVGRCLLAAKNTHTFSPQILENPYFVALESGKTCLRFR
jgi:hypothetical protein